MEVSPASKPQPSSPRHTCEELVKKEEGRERADSGPQKQEFLLGPSM